MSRIFGPRIVAVMLLAALGAVAWYGPSADTWAGLTLLAICGVLMHATVGAMCCRFSERPWLAGFAVFGWGYFALARWYSYHQGPVPTVSWLARAGDIHNDLFDLPPEVRMAHDAWTLALALFGAALAVSLGTPFSAPPAEITVTNDTNAKSAFSRWSRALVFLVLLAVAIATVALGAAASSGQWDSNTWAGLAFFSVWAMMGLAIVGAICARGRWREFCIGAASFGIGYLVLAFGPVMRMELPTDHLINAVFRPSHPTAADSWVDDDLTTDDESQRVRMVLREPIDLHFPEGTPLAKVLEHIRQAATSKLNKELVLYGRGDYPPVRRVLMNDRIVIGIDREHIPADVALRICLGRVGLTYRVQSGYIRIIPDACEPLPFAEDPVMIAGHSLLGLIAAAIGGVSALAVVKICSRGAW